MEKYLFEWAGLETVISGSTYSKVRRKFFNSIGFYPEEKLVKITVIS